jgi:hypothetical protein
LGKEVVLTSTTPITGGRPSDAESEHPGLLLSGIYSDIFMGTWHAEKVAVKGLRHVQATPTAIKVCQNLMNKTLNSPILVI